MDNLIHVLRVTPKLYRKGKWPMAYNPFGGVHNQVWCMTLELDKTGISQTVLTSHIPGYPRHSKYGNAIQVHSTGVSIPPFLATTLLSITWFFAVARHLISKHQLYDLVHISFGNWFSIRLLSILAKRLHLPVVVTLNTELWSNSPFPRLTAAKVFNLSQWLEGRFIRQADSVIALTRKDANRWMAILKMNPDHIRVIPDAVDLEKFREPIDHEVLNDFRARHNVPADKKIVTFIGRIRAEKGSADLAPLTKALKDSQAFVLICGDSPVRKKLEKALVEADCPDRWAITGYLPPEEVRIALRIADLLFLPSRREMLGSVLLEAMASGVPAVAYAVGGVVDVAGKEGAIRLVPPMDRKALSEAILDVLGTKTEYDRLVEKGHKRVEGYSLKRAAQKTISCYSDLLHKRITFDSSYGKPIELEP